MKEIKFKGGWWSPLEMDRDPLSVSTHGDRKLDHSGSATSPRTTLARMYDRLSTVIWRSVNGPLKVSIGFYLSISGLNRNRCSDFENRVWTPEMQIFHICHCLVFTGFQAYALTSLSDSLLYHVPFGIAVSEFWRPSSDLSSPADPNLTLLLFFLSWHRYV